MRRILFVALVLIAAGVLPAEAQTVTNPTRAVFVASPDHNVVSHGAPVVQRYDIQWFAQGASAPMQTDSLGKPTPNAQNDISVDITLLARPLALNTTFTAKVVAIGSGGLGVSDASNPFIFDQASLPAPGAPTNVRLERPPS